ncbi:hypothetical protein [Curtobacterium sp. MCBD17_040]|uniref:hypothetical protein n=1 Tax=Curtobacterium sp. MCBD17_040 TaxID=2175674 RepID=UPI0015E89024|nr:hypothetical protein [Curtobacterium sp. MCBD17_040]WIB65818.1 hypothetical protein DEI94_17030 [Curtobacterium sp. MCBD17_040]
MRSIIRRTNRHPTPGAQRLHGRCVVEQILKLRSVVHGDVYARNVSTAGSAAGSAQAA